jgi:ethanolaminephosphotransferase
MSSYRTLLLALANLLIPVAILVFATGFFPYKPFMQGLATHEDPGWEDKFTWNKEGQPEPVFDKLVFMVVDALRSDFVYGEGAGMGFVQRYVFEPFGAFTLESSNWPAIDWQYHDNGV